jgi:hypothetical protein
MNEHEPEERQVPSAALAEASLVIRDPDMIVFIRPTGVPAIPGAVDRLGGELHADNKMTERVQRTIGAVTDEVRVLLHQVGTVFATAADSVTGRLQISEITVQLAADVKGNLGFATAGASATVSVKLIPTRNAGAGTGPGEKDLPPRSDSTDLAGGQTTA